MVHLKITQIEKGNHLNQTFMNLGSMKICGAFFFKTHTSQTHLKAPPSPHLSTHQTSSRTCFGAHRRGIARKMHRVATGHYEHLGDDNGFPKALESAPRPWRVPKALESAFRCWNSGPNLGFGGNTLQLHPDFESSQWPLVTCNMAIKWIYPLGN